MGKSIHVSRIHDYRAEWGIPDWQDESTYGPVENWNKKRWQWEFYRRRVVVREYFDARAQDQYEQNQAFFELCPTAFQGCAPNKPNERGFQVSVAPGDTDEIGYMFLPNPRISAQPDMAIFPCSGAARVRPIEPPRAGCTVGELLEMANVELTARQRSRLGHMLPDYPVSLKDGEVALVFDYSLPLVPQFLAAKSYLESGYQQRELPKQRRTQPDKWLVYLRVLDGRAEGASWAEISALLPHTAQTEQTARDTWKAAEGLRFNF